MTDYYDPTANPPTGGQGSSSQIRDEFALIQQNISAKLPALVGNDDLAIFVDATGSALIVKSAADARTLMGLEIGVDVMAYATPANQRIYLELSSTDTPDFAGLTLGGIPVNMISTSWGAPKVGDFTLVEAAGNNIDCSSGTVQATLPTPMTVGAVFQVHRMDNVTTNICRILENGNTITRKDVAIGGNLTLRAGQSASLVATTTTTAEITNNG